MDVIKLQNTINALASCIGISEEKKKEMIDRYTPMSDVEVIKELANKAYQLLASKGELYDYVLTIIRNINKEICPPIEEMKRRLEDLFFNVVEGNMDLQANHKLVTETIVKFTTLFNQYGIDYYVGGSLACFIKIGHPLFRYHDDIDFEINENDISKVAEIMELIGYEFHDDRFPNLERCKEMTQNKPPHTVLAQNKDNEFHLGFFPFRREQDNSITEKKYSYRIVDEKVMIDVIERKSDRHGTELRFDDKKTEFMGTSFRTCTLESIYQYKDYKKRPKDITDMRIIEPFLNKERLYELRNHPTQDTEIKDIGNKQDIMQV